MNLDKDQLRDAYRGMRTIRMFEDRVHDEFATGQIPGFVHLYAGEEASAVGVIRHLRNDGSDTVASTHRGHGHSIAIGCDVKAMMKEIYGRQGGLCNGKGGSMHIADVGIGMLGANGIVGGGASLSCGAALTAKVKKTGGLSVLFFGDGAFNQGMTMEAMNFARIYDLPVLFVLEDNGYAESTASRWSIGGGNPVRRVAGFGIPGEKVDGRDFFAVTAAAAEAVRAIRAGEGPRFLHVRCLRYYGHFEGDATTYRPRDEVRNERKYRDPLNIFRARVTQGGMLDVAALDQVDASVARLIDEAVAEARTAPLPELATLTTDVYVSY